MNVNVTFNIKGYIDRRTGELKSCYDRIEARRDALKRRQVSVVSRLGPVGPDRQGGAGDSAPRPARIWPATARAPFRVVSVR